MELLQKLLALASDGNLLAQAAIYLGYTLAALGFVQTGLAFIAPKTKTKADDKALALSYKVLPFLKKVHEWLKQREPEKK